MGSPINNQTFLSKILFFATPELSAHFIFRSLELSIRHGLKDPNLEYFEVFRALAKDSARRSTGNLHENNNNASNTESSVGLVRNLT